MTPAEVPTLVQFPISHFCEKARWALEIHGRPYRTRNLVPVAHVPVAWALSRQTQVPILLEGERTVVGSAAIVDHLEAAAPVAILNPASAPEQAAARDWEARADARIGPAIRRLVYFYLLQRPALLSRLLAWEQPALVEPALRLGFPALARLLRTAMRVDAAGAARSTEVLVSELSALRAALRRRRYLVGRRFSRADLAAAALLAPLFRPAGYAVPLDFEEPEALQALRAAWPEVESWVRGLYRDHRGSA